MLKLASSSSAAIRFTSNRIILFSTITVTKCYIYHTVLLDATLFCSYYFNTLHLTFNDGGFIYLPCLCHIDSPVKVKFRVLFTSPTFLYPSCPASLLMWMLFWIMSAFYWMMLFIGCQDTTGFVPTSICHFSPL